MKFRANKMLGLAMGERSILVTELSANEAGCQVVRAKEFVYPPDATLQYPDALGSTLGQFIKNEGFIARMAVFGIPAKWVLTKSKEIPAIDPVFADDLLRLQVETEFSAELKDLVYDYAGQSNRNQPSHVMLAATQKKYVDQVVTIAESARLSLQGIAPTAVVLSLATSRGANDALVLSITPSSTELAAQRGSSPSLLRHIGSSSTVTMAVAGEVRRAAMMMPRNGATAGNGSSTNGHSHGKLVVWDDAGLDPAARRSVTDLLGPIAQPGDFSTLGAGSLPDGIPAYAAAAALAVAGVSEAGLPINFLHPRLAPPKNQA